MFLKLKNVVTLIFLAEDGREEALSSGGLDLIIFPGLGFTKVSVCIVF